MDSTIRCISQHAEEVVLSNGESQMVPAGDVAHDVDLSDPNNSRLLDEGLIAIVTEKEKPKRGSGQSSEGGDT